MKDCTIYFPDINYSFVMVFVKGATYLFGDNEKLSISVNDFFISKYPVTQRLWEYIIGNNPACFKGDEKPVEHVSFNDITNKNVFLDKLNASEKITFKPDNKLLFRLPSETEWEYAARGGIYWADGFHFSGSNNLNDVGWYEQNSGPITELAILHQLKNNQKKTVTHNAGEKAANQLGIFDMCGNVWEWCQDYFQRDINKIPAGGSPCLIESSDRVLRGGCHHNGDIHCKVYKRYEIIPDAADECIGFRIAASVINKA